jgi:hypothetical protein
MMTSAVVGDRNTVSLRISGRATNDTEDMDFTMKAVDLKNPHSWAAKLFGRRIDDDVTLSAGEGNVVTAKILQIL